VNEAVSDYRKEEIRTVALGLGFAACGFTDAEPLECGALLSGWIEAGRHGHMDYLGRDVERRVRPRAVHAAARSVIVLAWPYPAPQRSRADWRTALNGRIAAYAFGCDYHRELAERAQVLAMAVEERCGGSTRVQVDAGPLVEKELARRAGLGWYGHNTNVLTKESGSYLLLACVLTAARFEPDPPFALNHCGTCRACVPACPTTALDSGPTIDARTCISYLTIEHRGPVDVSLRAAMGNWVFGCDVCQEICPWNPADAAAASDLEPYLPDLLWITRDEFEGRFAGTAVARVKRRGLARNAAIVLGNTGNPAAIEPLSAAVKSHDEPIVRAHAAWALGRLASPSGRRALLVAESREKVPPVQWEIAMALASLNAQAAGPTYDPDLKA
jgi:epoxyqueuosine reductase